MVVCFLGIGSNLGNRRENIRLAIDKINSLPSTKVLRLSKIRETKPVGGPLGQKMFLNAVIKIETQIPPVKLLQQLKRIEKDLGRKKTIRNGPRSMDLDILLYADRIIRNNNLIIPHPRMLERKFVLKPLLELINSAR